MGYNSRIRAAVAWVVLAILFSAMPATAQTPSAAPIGNVATAPLAPVAAAATIQPETKFDPVKATNAYLSQIKGDARAKSNSYFEGGYWLILWDALYAIAISGFLLWTKISASMRNRAQAMTRSRFWQVSIYIVQYVVITTVLGFPLTVYEAFFREHQYGLSNQNFLQWFGDFGTATGVSLVAFALVGSIIYAVIRGARERWWLWGTLVTVGFLAFGSLIYPVFIAPLFNHYEPLKEGPLKSEILSLARANGIPATNVYEFDASRQTKRVSANVSGFLGTTRISLNDNLLNRSSEREILAVLGHEMGHYALGHNYTGLTWIGLVFFVAFAFVNWGFRFLTGIFGGNWDVRTLDDPAGLPVLMALSSLFFLFATPVMNTITRTFEAQADIFGVNASRQPDGFAMATLKLSEYRKLEPTPWEEYVFYDHPSGRSRIWMMMRWKAEHINDPDIKSGPKSPQ